ncbi:MAG: hypothetical protein ACRC33_10075, partial [Gemmataceae bacterium]
MQPLRDAVDFVCGNAAPGSAAAFGLLLLAGVAAMLWLGFRASALDEAQKAIHAGDYDRSRVWAERAVSRAGDDLSRAEGLDALGAAHRFAGANREAEAC